MSNFPYVITISSEKGGVGKTTLATNLAIFLKAMREDLPVSIFSFDNHFTIDRMFSLPNSRHEGTVAELLDGEPAKNLLKTGQYGISFIPSSNSLPERRSVVKGPMHLAKSLAVSGISGILIIDTRPELDVLTQNALYAADQVLIPVKDMASLENCKNIFALFDTNGLDKKSLSLLPCIIDSRIKFDGMFRDQRSLLKAFALNRGYRCLDTFISKSPKVDSLNTNPESKIYPVLTHAKGTDVYGQFALLSRHMLATISATDQYRSEQFSNWLNSENERRQAAYATRLATVKQLCPVCSSSFNANGHSPGLYFESQDSISRGYISSRCFFDLLAALLLPIGSLGANDPMGQLLRESISSATFTFRHRNNNGKMTAELKITEQGNRKIISKEFSFNEYSESFLNNREGALYRFLQASTGAKGIASEESFIIAHPVDVNSPERIMMEDDYRIFRKIKQQVANDL